MQSMNRGAKVVINYEYELPEDGQDSTPNKDVTFISGTYDGNIARKDIYLQHLDIEWYNSAINEQALQVTTMAESWLLMDELSDADKASLSDEDLTLLTLKRMQQKQTQELEELAETIKLLQSRGLEIPTE